MVDASQHQRVAGYVALARGEGATVWQSDVPLPKAGCFYPPTLISDIGTASAVVQDEIFGPVLVVLPFRTPAEAVELANHTVYGLAASIWSESISLALDVASQLKSGVVWINTANQFDASSGFGGYRESGFGRELGTPSFTWPSPGEVFPGQEPAGAARTFRADLVAAVDRAAGGTGVRRRDRNAFPLRRLGRQVRRPGSPAADARNRHSAQRAAGRDRYRLSRRGAVAGPDRAGGAGDCDGQPGGGVAVGAVAVGGHGPVPGAGHLRPARGRRQHSDQHGQDLVGRAGRPCRCDAVWRHDGDAAGCADVEQRSSGNLKRTWVGGSRGRDWSKPGQGRGQEFLRQATQVKNLWVPYGV